MLFIDSREPRGISSCLAGRIPVRVLKLRIGDYRFRDIVIERKTLSDFFTSLSQKRLLLQLQKMRIGAEKCYLIIEGFFDFSYVNNLNFLYRLLSKISIELETTILFSENQKSTAEIIRRLYWLDYGCKRRILSKHEERITGLLLLLGLSRNKLRKLFSNFGNLRGITNADTKSLLRIKGIGRRTAEKIKEVTGHNFF